MIDLEAARALLDFSARIDKHRAEEQLHGRAARAGRSLIPAAPAMRAARFGYDGAVFSP